MVAADGGSDRGLPQPLQKPLPGGFVRPQLEQDASRPIPHELQKPASAGFSLLHDEQRNATPTRSYT